MAEMVYQPRELVYLPVDVVHPWPDNPPIRLVGDAQLTELREHIRRNGQIEPVQVAIDYTIVCGHRRHWAIKSLGWPMIQAFHWRLPFGECVLRVLPTERMQRRWGGPDIGQAVLALGFERLRPALKEDDANILANAITWLGEDSESFRQLCASYGPRVFGRVRGLVNSVASIDASWTADRICRLIAAHGTYREVDEVKGPRGDATKVATRLAILTAWEREEAERD